MIRDGPLPRVGQGWSTNWRLDAIIALDLVIPRIAGSPIAARMPMMAITTSISINVNAAAFPKTPPATVAVPPPLCLPMLAVKYITEYGFVSNSSANGESIAPRQICSASQLAPHASRLAPLDTFLFERARRIL